jgi:hypothetical protein
LIINCIYLFLDINKCFYHIYLNKSKETTEHDDLEKPRIGQKKTYALKKEEQNKYHKKMNEAAMLEIHCKKKIFFDKF